MKWRVMFRLICFPMVAPLVACDVVGLGSDDPDLDGVYTLLTADGVEVSPFLEEEAVYPTPVSQVSFEPRPHTQISILMNSENPEINGVGAGGRYTFDPASGTVRWSWTPPPESANQEAVLGFEHVRVAVPTSASLDGEWLFLEISSVDDARSPFQAFAGQTLGYRENAAMCADPQLVDVLPATFC